MLILLFLIPVIICVSIAIKKRKPFYSAMLLSCIGCAAGILLCCLFIYALSGTDVISYNMHILSDAMKADANTTKEIYAGYMTMMNMGNVSDVSGTNINSIIVSASEVDFNTAYDMLYSIVGQAMATVIPNMFIMLCSFGALVFYLVPRAISKKRGNNVGFVPRFGDWQLPSFFGWGSVALVAVSLVMYLAEIKNYDFVINISYMLIFCVYTVQGLSVLEFMLRKKISSSGKRVFLIIIITVLVFLIWQPLFMCIGIVEQAGKFRRRSIRG